MFEIISIRLDYDISKPFSSIIFDNYSRMSFVLKFLAIVFLSIYKYTFFKKYQFLKVRKIKLSPLSFVLFFF